MSRPYHSLHLLMVFMTLLSIYEYDISIYWGDSFNPYPKVPVLCMNFIYKWPDTANKKDHPWQDYMMALFNS